MIVCYCIYYSEKFRGLHDAKFCVSLTDPLQQKNLDMHGNACYVIRNTIGGSEDIYY